MMFYSLSYEPRMPFQWTAGGSAAQFGLKDAESTLLIRKLQQGGELFLRPFCQLQRDSTYFKRFT